MRRKIRKIIEAGLPLLGSVVVFAGILLLLDPVLQVAAAAVGVLMIQAGIWRLTQPILPSERRYQALRQEVDYFIVLVRRLNAAALGIKEMDEPATRAAFEAAQQRMQQSFDRMALLAGKTDEEVAALNLANVEVDAK
ncbi:MAG: hypothetical protein ACT4O1_14810 [Gemmatimonadota bacterium]